MQVYQVLIMLAAFAPSQILTARELTPDEAYSRAVVDLGKQTGKSVAAVNGLKEFGAVVTGGEDGTIIVGRSGKHVFVHLDKHEELVSYSSDGGLTWAKWSPAGQFSCHAEAKEVALPRPSAPASKSGATSPTTVIDILIGFSPAVANALGGPEPVRAKALGAIAYLNESFNNSDLPFHASLVGVVQFNYGDFESDDCLEQALNALNWVSTSPETGPIRDTHYADLVHMFYRGPRCGLTRREGFSVSGLLSQLTPIKSVAHEIGHELGANHARDQGYQPCGSSGYCGYWQHSTTPAPRYQDFMTYEPGALGAPCDTCEVIPIFSSPALAYPNGSPAGTTVDDNASAIHLFGPIVAQNREYQPPTPTPFPAIGILAPKPPVLTNYIFANGLE